MLHLCVLCISCCPYLVLTPHPQIDLELLNGRDIAVVVVREDNVCFLFQLRLFSSFLLSNELGLPLGASWTPYRCTRTRCASKGKPDSRLYSWYPIETEHRRSSISHLVTAFRLLRYHTIWWDMWGQCLLGRPPPSALLTNSPFPTWIAITLDFLFIFPYHVQLRSSLKKLDLVFFLFHSAFVLYPSPNRVSIFACKCYTTFPCSDDCPEIHILFT